MTNERLITLIERHQRLAEGFNRYTRDWYMHLRKRAEYTRLWRINNKLRAA